MCYYGNMFDHGCASLVFLWSAMVVYPYDTHKVSKLLTGKKGQLKKEVPSVATMTNFGFGPMWVCVKESNNNHKLANELNFNLEHWQISGTVGLNLTYSNVCFSLHFEVKLLKLYAAIELFLHIFAVTGGAKHGKMSSEFRSYCTRGVLNKAQRRMPTCSRRILTPTTGESKQRTVRSADLYRKDAHTNMRVLNKAQWGELTLK